MGKHILVVEDDTNIRRGLIDGLESEGYTVTWAIDGEAGLCEFRAMSIDLVLLDVMMPKLSGYDVCRAIRKTDAKVPIIMLTAKSEEIDKVVGLELGADDYIAKPFGIRELLARIKALFRRVAAADGTNTTIPNTPDTFRIGTAEINTAQYLVERDETQQSLTAKELGLLKLFFSNPGKVFTRDQLLDAVWGIDYLGTTRTLDQHIAQLRKKIETDPNSPKHIVTVHRVGYRYSSEEH